MKYTDIPENMMIAINEYVDNGRPLGGFLKAVFANDLYQAIARADDESLDLLRTYVSYVHWETHDDCNGSYEKIKNWIDSKNP